ncbi:MAG: GIY-YIG nuclease family protein [Prevotella sp.]|nr:GIY-YIG nuclease family protein [Prevotella sp.]
MITNQNRYTYIVRCEDGSFYTGYAKDIVRRLRSHYSSFGFRMSS